MGQQFFKPEVPAFGEHAPPRNVEVFSQSGSRGDFFERSAARSHHAAGRIARNLPYRGPRGAFRVEFLFANARSKRQTDVCLKSRFRAVSQCKPSAESTRAFSSSIAALLLKGMVILTGCSVNDFGIVETRTLSVGDGVARYLSAPGLHVDARQNSASLTLGWLQSASVFANSCRERLQDRFSFRQIHAWQTPHLSYSRAFGLHIAMNANLLSFNLGAREHFRAFAPNAIERSTRSLQFVPGAIEKTRLTLGNQNRCH